VKNKTVPVQAEWALWGKDASDHGYHLLNCSDGTVSQENFKEVITRYEPGTLEALPQVTISWILDREKTKFLAVAIHDRADNDGAAYGRFDVSGREIVLTSYFCLPWGICAAGAVSYSDMYDTFRSVPLPRHSRGLVERELAHPGPGEPANAFTMRTAALLLTGRPVCILGASHLDVGTRLRFLDSVMSLLPYGMRSRLSASTWVSSTFREHRIRLFFASAARQRDDHVITWDQPGYHPIGLHHADMYLAWLQRGAGQRPAQLAGETTQIGFSAPEVNSMVERLSTRSRRPARLALPAGAAPMIPAFSVEITTMPSLQDLLVSCGEHLASEYPLSVQHIDRLEEYTHDPATSETQLKNRRIIREWQLLRDDIPLESQILHRYYRSLLQLAFAMPLTYQDLFDIEACLDNSMTQVLHQSLLRALLDTDLDDHLLRVLLWAFSAQDWRPELGENAPLIADLFAAAANRELSGSHGRLVCDAAIRWLSSPGFSRAAIQAALKDHGYLAEVLQWRESSDPDYQLSTLTRLLQIAHGDRLDRSAVQEVLWSGISPTRTLLVAVLRMVDPADRRFVERTYSLRLVATTGFASATVDQMRGLLPEGSYPDAGQRSHPARRGIRQRISGSFTRGKNKKREAGPDGDRRRSRGMLWLAGDRPAQRISEQTRKSIVGCILVLAIILALFAFAAVLHNR
jgi:hypothetical protein